VDSKQASWTVALSGAAEIIVAARIIIADLILGTHKVSWFKGSKLRVPSELGESTGKQNNERTLLAN